MKYMAHPPISTGKKFSEKMQCFVPGALTILSHGATGFLASIAAGDGANESPVKAHQLFLFPYWAILLYGDGNSNAMINFCLNFLFYFIFSLIITLLINGSIHNLNMGADSLMVTRSVGRR
jgi:hypothetical protein